MERKIILNYDKLNNYLIEWQKDPNWTNWQLTILRDNCKNNLADTLSNKKEFIITINETTWEITINWEKNLQEKFYMLPSCYGMDDKARLYRQIKQALEEAKDRWFYDKVFKEIKDTKE